MLYYPVWGLHKLSPCAREKKGLHSNALAVGVCRLPRLPGDAAQNWEDGNRPVFGELWANSEHPYTYGRVQRDQALPFFTEIHLPLWPMVHLCRTALYSGIPRKQALDCRVSSVELQPWLICYLIHCTHLGISCWGFIFPHSLSRNYWNSPWNQLCL